MRGGHFCLGPALQAKQGSLEAEDCSNGVMVGCNFAVVRAVQHSWIWHHRAASYPPVEEWRPLSLSRYKPQNSFRLHCPCEHPHLSERTSIILLQIKNASAGQEALLEFALDVAKCSQACCSFVLRCQQMPGLLQLSHPKGCSFYRP